MASSSAEWPIGWIIPDTTEYLYTVPLLGPNAEQGIRVGNNDDLVWTKGELYGKKIILVNASRLQLAYASANMKQAFGIKILFVGGTYQSMNSLHPIGHCNLKMPYVDDWNSNKLATSIPRDDIESLAQLSVAKDLFITRSKEGHFNLNRLISQWAENNQAVNHGLIMPPATPDSYEEWPAHKNDQMCCGKEFNNENYTNQTPCLKVLGLAGYRGRADNDIKWLKYATLKSAAAIAGIIFSLTV
ncbi:hypothetical protein TRIATDRAFT_310512 [Trichoderma atroviride IMI 206040]|uniref:Uncharacterized protein n=1 Tax=Hypocrea atroviridis (strain ATCC 20476 / IMI 206040) TaxID=452589 RepID=G9P3G9_HYPAI|nr:uncharacterized protein TRIATDRAFT_310512 [Trichoderma atroviride IMI 206040]EHK42927.1 hypothetical protein TRIATDRAFT_310512 [Trichoderma atroviride IMI 206040]